MAASIHNNILELIGALSDPMVSDSADRGYDDGVDHYRIHQN